MESEMSVTPYYYGEKPVCRYLQSGLIASYFVNACCVPQSGPTDELTLLTKDDFYKRLDSYKHNLELMHHDIEEKRNSLIRKFHKNELVICKNCPSFVPHDSDSKLITFINAGLIFRCHLDCVFCMESNKRETLEQRKVLDVMGNYLEYLAKNKLVSDTAEILWTGGEPTLLPNFEKILKIFSYVKRPQQILTNAVQYSTVIEKLLYNNKASILVSIDAGTRETYKKIKQRDLFDKVINNIRTYATRNSSAVHLKYIITPGYNDNDNDVDNFFQLCRKNDIKNISIAFDFNQPCSDKDFEFLKKVLKKYPMADIGYLLIFTRFTAAQRAILEQEIAVWKKSSIKTVTDAAYNLFSGVFEKEVADDFFFWTKLQFTFCPPKDFCGILFDVHSLSENMEVTVLRKNGNQEKFYAPRDWTPCGLRFDDDKEALLFSCSQTVTPPNDTRELGICIKNITFTNDMDKVMVAIKKNARFHNGRH